MKSQAAKNIRQAFPVITFGSREYEVTQSAARWVVHSHQQVQLLAELDLLTVAHRCLVAGETLEDVGASGPYGTASQRRAWAAGRLAAACHAIAFAEQLEDQVKASADAISRLERKVELLRAETRAAARFKDVVVPFRAPRRQKSVDWDAA